MTKKTTPNPAMEGSVNRAIDFSLKKEDLMLLILEGRKEVMEAQIAALQTKSTSLRQKLNEAQKTLERKVEKLVVKTLNADAKKLAEAFGVKTEDDKMFLISLSAFHKPIPYTKFISKAIGEKGGSYIKVESEASINFYLYHIVRVDLNFALDGKVFANKNNIFRLKDSIPPCRDSNRSFTILDTQLDTEEQKLMPEYLVCESIAKELANNESLYSDIITEYDLFNRNQTRAKAKMIKEVLSRDEAGQAILGNIIAAASGIKLLG